MVVDDVMDKPMDVDELLKEEPEIYDLMYDPQEMEWDNMNNEVREILIKDPYGVIYGLMQHIKEMEAELYE